MLFSGLGVLDRHLLREISKPFLFSICFVVALVFLLQVRRLSNAALGLALTLTDALTIFGAALPSFLVVVIPLAFLTSVLIGLGRMAADLETTALLAAGISPWRIARVPLLLGTVVTLATIPIAHIFGPAGLDLLYERLVDVGVRNISQAVRPGVFNEDLDGIVLYARDGEDGALEGLLVYDERDRKNPVLSVAESGDLKASDQSLILQLRGGEMHRGITSDHYDRLRFGEANIGIDLQRELRNRTRFVSESQRMSSAVMITTFQKGDNLYSRRTERDFWRRFAHPLMALIFGLIGTAIALGSGPRQYARKVVSALVLIILFFLLSRGADYMVTKDLGPPFIAVLMPNAVLLAVGSVLLARAGKPR